MIGLSYVKENGRKKLKFFVFLYASKDKITQKVLQGDEGVLAIQNPSNLKCTVERYSDLTTRNLQSFFP